MKNLAASALVLVLCVSAAPGGPLKTERVAGDARWVAHIDVDAALTSGTGKVALDEAAKKEKFHAGLEKIRQTLGFRPLKDVRGLTLYGKDYARDMGVAVIDVTAEQDKLLALLVQNEAYKRIEYGDHTLHKWTAQPRCDEEGEVVSEGKTHVGCFYDENTIVIASTVELLQAAVDVLDGKAESLAKTKALKMLPVPAEGAFLVAAAEGIRLPKAKHPRAAMLRKITDAAVQIGESDGSVFLKISVLAGSVKKATRIRQVAQGFVALAQMWMQEMADEQMPALGEKIEVTGTENAVQLDATVPTESLIEVLRYAAARAEKIKARIQEAKQPGD